MPPKPKPKQAIRCKFFGKATGTSSVLVGAISFSPAIVDDDDANPNSVTGLDFMLDLEINCSRLMPMIKSPSFSCQIAPWARGSNGCLHMGPAYYG